MTHSRNITNKVNWIFDNLIPPVLRDSKYFMFLWFWILFGNKSKYFMEFKEKVPFLTKEDFEKYYHILSDKHIKRETDLNSQSVKKVLESIVGETVLDAGSGRGFLAKKIVETMNIKVTGIDINISEKLKKCSNPSFIEGNIEVLPFSDKSFDTIICSHTLEHVQNIDGAIKELRRIARKRLIIIVPKQREYKYTFDLHLHFFPYVFSLQKIMKNINAQCFAIDNDLFYLEDIKN